MASFSASSRTWPLAGGAAPRPPHSAFAPNATRRSGIPPSTILPPTAEAARHALLEATDAFFNRHNLRIKIRKLPLPADEVSGVSSSSSSSSPSASSSSVSASPGGSPPCGSGMSLPLFHFVVRQKRHLTEQLMRNRHSYRTSFNAPGDFRTAAAPWIMQEMSQVTHSQIMNMADDFDDPEFSGVWLSLHSPPFVTDSEYGSLARSKIVAWALMEVLTTNERYLKALWIHPHLSATATSNLLLAFLPRCMLEAFSLVAQQNAESCPWKFFYCWMNDFDMLPRQAWLCLASPRYLGLPRHCDNLPATAEPPGGAASSAALPPPPASLAHVDDGDPVGSACACQVLDNWDAWEEVLVGCTESFLCQRAQHICKFIPTDVCPRLLDDVEALPHDLPENHKKMQRETKQEIERAETMNISSQELVQLLRQVYGKWCNGRLKGSELLVRADGQVVAGPAKGVPPSGGASSSSAPPPQCADGQEEGADDGPASKKVKPNPSLNGQGRPADTSSAAVPPLAPPQSPAGETTPAIAATAPPRATSGAIVDPAAEGSPAETVGSETQPTTKEHPNQQPQATSAGGASNAVATAEEVSAAPHPHDAAAGTPGDARLGKSGTSEGVERPLVGQEHLGSTCYPTATPCQPLANETSTVDPAPTGPSDNDGAAIGVA
eukprot:GHVT01033362.1.p1 GENE.GHVT01033362.1~~GHVT01033362.1.p1  ORF type:complete len:664 (+),score=183.99 GHVT01033362.1:503-2494(+)